MRTNTFCRSSGSLNLLCFEHICFQKLKRKAIWIDLGPACEPGVPSCSELTFPNEWPLATLTFGIPQLLMLNRLANCASYLTENRSPRFTVFPIEVENVTVFGPSRMPTPQLPKRPILLAGML